MVTLRFKNSAVGIVIDRFGTDIDIRPIDENFSSARVSVNVSNQFFGWITSIGGDIVIEAPEDTKKAYIAFLHDSTNLYK